MTDAGAQPLTSALATDSGPWRAARACASILAWLEDAAPPDTVLAALGRLGDPPQGWWDVLAQARRGGPVLRLPLPGDPRGLALPRHIEASACLGWRREAGGSMWLIPGRSGTWDVVELADQVVRPWDPAQCLRDLRSEVVRAAHILDSVGLDSAGGPSSVGSDRSTAERMVDSWLLDPLPLPPPRCALATVGLRVLVAMEQVGPPARAIDVRALSTAARAAVEAAYSADGLHG